jgi:hypothetical protein
MEDHEFFSFWFFEEGGVRMKQADEAIIRKSSFYSYVADFLLPPSLPIVLALVFSEWWSQLPGRGGGHIYSNETTGTTLNDDISFSSEPPSS